MNAGRLPLFCTTALAERIERVEAQLVATGTEAAHRRRADTAGFVIPIAGGVASFAEVGSPLNKVAGLDFGGVPSAAALDQIEQAFTARGAPVQIELSHLADPAIAALLTDRGYQLGWFENVLGLALEGEPEASNEEFSREVIARVMRDFAAVGVMRYVALRDGVIAGGASFRLAEGVAQFAGAATAPVHRRQGIQTALLSARNGDAAAAGCDVAVITTQPGSKSQQNAQRRGFDLLYTRAVLVKQP